MSLPSPRLLHATWPTAAEFALGHLSLLVFGPGNGEAQVLIFPDGSLGVVDGCKEPQRADGSDDPVRSFVQGWLRAHPGKRLRFVALTHPHDDHYAGLGRLIVAHDPDIDALWRAPMTDQWGKAYIRHRRREDPNLDKVPTSGIVGLERVFKALAERRVKIDVLVGPKQMFSGHFDGGALRVTSIAPSLNDVDRTQYELLERVYDQDSSRPRFDPNHTSAAFVIEWHRSRILLGGDLLVQDSALDGWSAAGPLVTKQCQIIKVAHHASSGAQDLDLLTRLKPKLCVVTPFKYAGAAQPPRPEDITRLRGLAPVAITSPPRWCGDPSAPQPSPPIPAAAAAPRRNPALAPSWTPAPGAVCVSLNKYGKVTQLLLTGGARPYNLP